MMSNDFVGTLGWAVEREKPGFSNWDELVAKATPFELPMMGDPPEEIDPRPHHEIENQGPVGACQGFCLSSILEHCYWIASRGKTIRLSPAHAYYGTQRLDGLLGRDSGSTISGGVKLATETGLVTLDVWPYVARYNPKPPMSWEEIEQRASESKIRSHSRLKSYDEVFNYIATGTGGVSTGTSWGFKPNAEGLVERWSGGSGGHATPLLGYSKRKDSKGRNYLWLPNSWSKTWGIDGWAEIAPAAIDQVFSRDRNAVFFGLSDLTVPEVRPFSFAENPGI